MLPVAALEAAHPRSLLCGSRGYRPSPLSRCPCIPQHRSTGRKHVLVICTKLATGAYFISAASYRNDGMSPTLPRENPANVTAAGLQACTSLTPMRWDRPAPGALGRMARVQPLLRAGDGHSASF